MATKNLEDVVAICPKFFDDSTNVDLLKEQIEIYNLGLKILSSGFGVLWPGNGGARDAC